MEMMPYQQGMEAAALAVPRSDALATGWRAQVPVLQGAGMRLRELQLSDAASLCALLNTEDVARFISPPPTTVAAFEDFIHCSHVHRAQGRYICFGVVPDGYEAAVGIFQIQLLAGETPEWGFVIGSPFWGTGLFTEGAIALLDFAFDGMGLELLAARAAVANGRGNGALRKIGAVREELIPNGLLHNGLLLDQYYWTSSPHSRPRRTSAWDVAAH
jgi:ribosomal-protein-alanine N-acetyltransferase